MINLLKKRSRYRVISAALAVILFSFSAYAQNITITGKITDKEGNPVIGAAVLIKGTRTGSEVQMDGTYSITAPANGELEITSIGMTTVVVPINNRSVINVVMEIDALLLEEAVVIGFGTQKKENLTGAVSTVDTKMLEARPISDVGRGLQGVAPGLNVVIPSGEVGSDPRLRIRGQYGSLEGGATPLILMDNVEIPSIQMINPDDVESISILKDAASSSIYGAKAAFGVILITTKKGAKTESVNVSYSGNVSFQNISKKMEMGGVDAMEYTVLAFERVNGTVAGAFMYATREGYEKAKEWQNRWGNVVKNDDPYVYGRDWYMDANNRKIGLRPFDPYQILIKEWAPTHQHNVSVNGKSGNTAYNASFGYIHQSGMMKTAKEDSWQRYNGAIRVNTDINKYINLYAGAMYSKRVKKYAYATSSTTADPWLYLYRWSAFYPLVDDEHGNPLRSPAYETSAANTASQETNYASLNGGINLNLTRDWNINFDFTHANQEYVNLRPGTRYTAGDVWAAPVARYDSNGNRVYVNDSGQVVDSGSAGAMAAYQFNNYTYTSAGANPDHIYRYSSNSQWNTLLLTTNYNLNIKDTHMMKFMLGMQRVGYRNDYNWSQITNLLDITNPQFDLATGTQTTSGGMSWNSTLGFFGRVNYNYKERYLLEANLRYDGSSKFPGALKWRWFPSFSAGWRLDQEDWMQWAFPAVSALKLRASWGMIGDQSVSSTLYVPTMSGSENMYVVGGKKLYQFGTPASVHSEVTWQNLTTLNLGIDARFIRNKLGVTVEWFQKDHNNMIVPMEGIPATYGTTAPKSNFGSFRTTGLEVQMDFHHQFSNGLFLNFVATLADAKTKVTKYGTTTSIASYYVGKTMGEIWGYETDRLYQKDDFAYDSAGNLIEVDSKDGYKVYQLADGTAATQGRLQAGSFKFGPGDVKFKDLNGDGIITPGNGLLGDTGDRKIIGNSTPRWEYSFRVDAEFKGFDASVFLQGVGSRQVWGQGFLAIPGFNSADGAMPQAFAGDFWREDRTDAFYPRPLNLSGSNNTMNLVTQSRYLLNMAYLRIKNITVGYTLPQRLTNKVAIKKLRLYVALENFFTFDNLGTLPIDPEEVAGYSMWNSSNYNSGRDGVGTPTFKSASVGIQINF